jgi:hypothetical protein
MYHYDIIMNLPESVILNIFSFSPSFVFYKNCKRVLKYSSATIFELLSKYYFSLPLLSPPHSVHPDSSVPPVPPIPSYLFLDYFLHHKHLLILDNYQPFEEYLKQNVWARELCCNHPTNQIIHHSLRNIMRLSYFVNCLRELARYQRQMTNDKIEQSNIGISYQCLIECVNKESEEQSKMLKHYMRTTTNNFK